MEGIIALGGEIMPKQQIQSMLEHIINTTDKIIGIAENCIDVTMNDACETGKNEPLRLKYAHI